MVLRAVLVLVLVGSACRDGNDRRADELIAAAHAQRCPRPALRAPAGPDGTALLRRLRDRASPEHQCLARVSAMSSELVAPCPGDERCALPKLSTIGPYPEILAACAALYDTIARLAHADEACSPETADVDVNDFAFSIVALQHAVRIQIAPLVARGELAAAAAHVLDALRVADDYGRGAVLIGAMSSLGMITNLVEILDEILIDPRLSRDEARAIAGDLDTLIATAPAFIATMHQEAAWIAKHRERLAPPGTDANTGLFTADRRTREIDRLCGGTLRACADGLSASAVDDIKAIARYVQKLATRDVALAFVRMQAELRTVAASDCSDPARRRATLARWLAADRAILGDGPEPIVTPPAWQHEQDRPQPWTLHCVSASR